MKAVARISGVLLALALAVVAFGQELPSRVVNVALFKNGYGMVVREVTLPAGVKEAVIADVPTPVHGTFWVLSPPTLAVLSVTAKEGESQRVVPAISLLELLKANVGETIEVKTEDGWQKGKLISVASARENKPPAFMPNDGGYNNYSSYRSSGGFTPGDLLTLETKEVATPEYPTSMLALPASSVKQIRKPAGTGALKTTFALEEKGAVLRINTDGAGGVVKITYLTRGITWAPSYRLDLSGQKARLSAKATIINDEEDFSTPLLSCLAGFPNMPFKNITDPLALQGTVTSFLNSLLHGSSDDGGSPLAYNMSQVTSNASYMPSSMSYPTMNPDDGDDLHSYTFKDIVLGQGERAALPIFDMEVPSMEYYSWDVMDAHEGGFCYGWRGNPTKTLQAADIWHRVRLRNTGKQVWTTAPILFTDGDDFLGQDTLYYTSVGATVTLDINKAIDVKARYTENTVDSRGTTKIGDDTYHIYIITGKLTIMNFKRDTVNMVINKKLTGDIIESEIKPSAVNEAVRKNVANPNSTAIWEVKVPAGDTKEIKFQYKLLVR